MLWNSQQSHPATSWIPRPRLLQPQRGASRLRRRPVLVTAVPRQQPARSLAFATSPIRRLHVHLTSWFHLAHGPTNRFPAAARRKQRSTTPERRDRDTAPLGVSPKRVR